MAQPLSQETLELSNRAQRAIDRSIQIRADTRQHLTDAERCAFEMGLLPMGLERVLSKEYVRLSGRQLGLNGRRFNG
jgi:hypothetical protein